MCQDNIKTKVGVVWTQPVQDMDWRQALVQTVINIQVPQKAENVLTVWATTSICLSR
jgi:hypothetical protein